MTNGIAIEPALVSDDGRIFSEGFHVNVARLSECWKCPNCGHSFADGPRVTRVPPQLVTR